MLMFRIAINKLFQWLFSSVLASHRRGLGLILAGTCQSRDLQFRIEITLVKSLHNYTMHKNVKWESVKQNWQHFLIKKVQNCFQGTDERKEFNWFGI
jgi:hypothetical protein